MKKEIIQEVEAKCGESVITELLMPGTTDYIHPLPRTHFSREEAIPLAKTTNTPASQIKLLKKGFGPDLKYVSGSTVISTLNSVHGAWDFRIISSETVECIPKVKKAYNAATKKQEPVLDSSGQPVLEYQAPYVSVCGEMTIPGLGTRAAYGSQGLMGGQGEQESAFKSASTDCLKKCASLFGIHLDLYESDEDTANRKKMEEEELKRQIEAAKPKYTQEDLDAIKKLKTVLGITSNEGLDKYVIEFTGRPEATNKDLNPTNMKDFCLYTIKTYGLEV